jgi:ferrous iron transport protein A
MRSRLVNCGYNREPFLFAAYLPVRLSELLPGNTAVVHAVEDVGSADPIARRLRDLGFVAGEPVTLVGRGPVGGDPLLVQVGFTRFALRRSEAARIRVNAEAGA